MGQKSLEGDPWQQAETIILGIGERNEAEIPAYLRQACGGDESLKRRVERLLGHDDDASAPLGFALANHAASLLQQSPQESSSALPPEEEDTAAAGQLPDRIGAFRLVQKLGEGGSGTVYLAERADDLYEHQVAIKVLSQGPWNDRLQRRFAAERQILAGLEHPNIARLLDGGHTAGGIPYFAMELVDGEPIDRYCDRHRQGLEQRLKLFMEICAAVHFAHTCQVVHRDLKPSNVYVSSRGTVKLLDFGIAKLLRQNGEAEGSATATPAPMTPRYASPEQLQGHTVTTASDIYSLGLLLHLLLTGRKPFGEQTSPAGLWQLRARGEMPDRPSTTVDASPESKVAASDRRLRPRELRRRLAGDLDNIVAMALHEKPEKRYASAAQLAEDVERHLSHRPVRARRDQLGYRQLRFVRRHWWAVTAALAITSLLVVGLVTVSRQSARISKERDRANKVSAMLTDLFNTADRETSQGSEITARELLDRGAEKVIHLPPDPETAVLMSTLARLYSRLGLADQAIPLLQSTLAIQSKNQGEQSAEVADTLNALAIGQVTQGDYEAARDTFQRVLDIRLAVYGKSHKRTYDSLNNLALINHDLGLYREARELYSQVLREEREIFGAEYFTTTHSNLALLHFDEGDYQTARNLYSESHRRLEARLGPDHVELAEPLRMLGQIAAERGDATEAYQLTTRAHELSKQEFGDNHPHLARSWDALGAVLLANGDPEHAEEWLRQALDLRLQSYGELHAETAWSYERWGDLKAAQGDVEAARQAYSSALQGYEQSFPEQHPITARARHSLGALLAENSSCDSALQLLRVAAATRSLRLANGSWPHAETRAAIGLCTADVEEIRQAHGVLSDHLGESHRRTGRLATWIDHLAAGSSEADRSETSS